MEPTGDARDAPRDAPPPLHGADAQATRTRVRTQASGRAAVVVAVLSSLMWLVVNSRALMTLSAGLVFAVVLDAWLARRSLTGTAGQPELHPVGDAEAGRSITWSIGIDRVPRPITVRPAGDRATAPLLVDRRGTAELTLPPRDRGVVHVVDVDLLASGPIGLCRAARRHRLVPARPRVVGPETVTEPVRWPAPAGLAVEMTRPTPRGDDLFRGVRPYQRGDERRKVHWKATARVGRIMVREDEGTGFVALQVVVEDADAAGLAAKVVAAGRAEGWAVQLVTLDDTPDPPPPVALGSPFRRLPANAARSSAGSSERSSERSSDVHPVAQLVPGPEAVRRQLATAVDGTPVTPPWNGIRCRITRAGLDWS